MPPDGGTNIHESLSDIHEFTHAGKALSWLLSRTFIVKKEPDLCPILFLPLPFGNAVFCYS